MAKDIEKIIPRSTDKISYLSMIEDNFSKFILNGQTSKTPVSSFIKNCFADVVKKYGLATDTATLVTDNGCENKGELDIYLQTEMRTIKKIVARVDIPQANNVVESLH
jgi:putative transposase